MSKLNSFCKEPSDQYVITLSTYYKPKTSIHERMRQSKNKNKLIVARITAAVFDINNSSTIETEEYWVNQFQSMDEIFSYIANLSEKYNAVILYSPEIKPLKRCGKKGCKCFLFEHETFSKQEGIQLINEAKNSFKKN